MSKFPPSNRYALERGQHEQNENGFRNEDRNVSADSATPPYPGSESAGPALYDLINRTSHALLVQEKLIKEAIPHLTARQVIESVSGITDANGNLDLRIFVVPSGFKLQVTRVNVEDA